MKLVTKTYFATLCGVSRAAITKATAPGGCLRRALLKKKINLDSETAMSYLDEKGVRLGSDGTAPVVATAPAVATASNKMPPPSTGVAGFEKMTLSELCSLFGTDEQFKGWLASRKIIVSIKAQELKLAQDRGEVVSKALVKKGIIDPIEGAHLKLLTDGSKTIARRVTAMHAAGRDLSDVEKFVSEQISSFIRPMKAKIKRSFKNV